MYLKNDYENDITRYLNDNNQQRQEQKATTNDNNNPPSARAKEKLEPGRLRSERMQQEETVSHISIMQHKHEIVVNKEREASSDVLLHPKTSRKFNKTNVEIRMQDENTIHLQQQHDKSSNNMYWNLSCPIELSMFSGVHMGGDFEIRAEKARDVAIHEAMKQLANINWKQLENRRIFFIGDSLLRQVFISMACLWWDSKVLKYAIPWYEKRGVRMRQPNTIGNGPHSKFEEGRILLKGNIELIFHHGIGKLLELGDEYQSHNEGVDSWLQSCYQKDHFEASVPKLPKSHVEQRMMSTLNVEREKIKLKGSDIVLINASVHGGKRSFNIQNIGDLFRCKSMIQYPDQHWPEMRYVVTGPMHFPTETGAFEQELIETDDSYYNCSMTSSFHGYQDEERNKLHQYMPFIGNDLLPFQFESGDLHVGGKDCLHWLQPGIPDLVTFKVLDSLLSSSDTKRSRKLWNRNNVRA